MVKKQKRFERIMGVVCLGAEKKLETTHTREAPQRQVHPQRLRAIILCEGTSPCLDK